MRKTSQRGVALILSIFALLLLSAVALAMLFSSDTETTISVNYRDKQAAIYGALAGLQEARDRIHPMSGDLGPGTKLSTGGLSIVPTVLPSTSAANVLYLINPAPGETVAPWLPTIGGQPNPYFDDELCHESYFVNNLGVTGVAAGTPCPATSVSVPTGNAWYTWYDNSQKQTKAGGTGTGDAALMETAYQLKDSNGNKIPLNYKWVRIMLKADNMTPVTVGTGNGTQVCWDGSHEQQLPAGYRTDCTPRTDGVTNITVTAPGAGYTSPPTVTITGGGTGATATAIIGQLPSGVTSVTLTDPGAGYTSPPAVTIASADGMGSGAVVNSSLSSTVPVTAVNPPSPGVWASPPACYHVGSAPTVKFNPDAGATASATMGTNNSCVYSFDANGTCTAKNATATVTANGTGTVAFSGTVTSGTNKKVTGTFLPPDNPGSYTVLPSTFTVSAPCAGITITPTYGVQVASVAVTSGGSYQAGVPPAVTISGGSPVGGVPSGTAVLSSTANPSPVAGLTIPIGGSGAGYDMDPILTIAPPSCTPLGTATCKQATGTASITVANGVTGIQVTNAGSGYSEAVPPTVTISAPPSGPGATTATAVATVGAGGTYWGQVYLLTAMAMTPTGARAIMQAETGVNYDKFRLGLGGALTLIGPNPTFGTPNSQNFKIDGTDCPTCGSQPPGCNTTPIAARDSIGVYDPTNATNPSAVQTVINSLGKPNNYIGVNSAPDVHNANLGNLTSGDLNAVVNAVAGIATAGAPAGVGGLDVYNSNPSSIYLGSATNPAIDVVYGDYSMGPTTGYGILVVTGTLTISGDYGWNGLILVIGSGASIMNGGGHGEIDGAIFVANTASGTLSSPSASWNGGGGNGVRYNHCWADDMLSKIPYVSIMSPNALQVISLRTEVY